MPISPLSRASKVLLPPRKNTRKPDWVVRKVIQMKAMHPQAGCRHIAQTFNRIHSVSRRISVSSSYVHYTLRQHHYEMLELRRRFKRRLPPPVPINDTWAIDLTGKADAFGETHAILGILDHGSRKLVSLKTVRNNNAWSLLGHLFMAIGNFGKPAKLRSDNDAVFKSAIFRTVLALSGIRQQFSDPGCPWMNGRIERLFGTLKAKLNRFKINGRDTLDMLLPELRFWYNAARPHQNLQGRTPNEVWHGIDLFARAPKSGHFFSAWDGALRGYYLRY